MLRPASPLSPRQHLGWIAAMVVASIVLWDAPVVSWILTPLKIFITTIHELGHATVCLLTGGSVSGLTIVSDHDGHGGLTFCRGGNQLLISPAGYLGTTLFGCALILLGRQPRLSRYVLGTVGVVICLASLGLMSGTLLMPGHFLEALGSMAWGLALGAALFLGAVKMSDMVANFVLLFLGVQTALDSLSAIILLIRISMQTNGVEPWSDATNMATMTHVPALVWAILWGATSVAMAGGTLWVMFKAQTSKA